MELTVDMSVPASVEIGATGLRGLAQEIRTALATRKGSVPLDRDFGLSWELIDLPLPESRPLLVAEIGRGLEGPGSTTLRACLTLSANTGKSLPVRQ